MPAIDAAMHAVRNAALVTRLEHACALRLKGPGALDLIDAATTSRLFIRESQILQTLMLDDDAQVFADVLVGQDEEGWLLLAEGPQSTALIAHLESIRLRDCAHADVHVEDVLAHHHLWTLDGPFAWEVVSKLLGTEILGAPYLSLMHLRGVICLRVGKTGEYGYTLLVPQTIAESTWERLLALGQAYDLAEGNLGTLDQCALENWHFFMRALLQPNKGLLLTPLELQLQWRVDYGKDFAGAKALRQRREQGLTHRLTAFVATHEVHPGDTIQHASSEIGTVLATGWSATRQDWVGWAVLSLDYAWPGVRYQAIHHGNRVPIETRSAPLLNNRSLFVDPRRQVYQERDEIVFPPLVPT